MILLAVLWGPHFPAVTGLERGPRRTSYCSLSCQHPSRRHSCTNVLISESVHENVRKGQSLQFLAAPASGQLPRKPGPSLAARVLGHVRG